MGGGRSVQVSFVISSGKDLVTHSFPASSSIQEIKVYLRWNSSLKHKFSMHPLIFYDGSSSSKAFAPSSCLFTYKGEELDESSKIAKIAQPICVLRSSDRVIPHITLSGDVTRTVINAKEDIVWDSSPALEFLLVGTNSTAIRCDALPTHTVRQLKLRLTQAVKVAEMQLWYGGRLLEDEKQLKFYKFEGRSKLTLQLPGDMITQASDLEGRKAIIPVTYNMYKADIGKIARMIVPDWTNWPITHEYTCVAPIYPHISCYLLHSSPSSTLLPLVSPHFPPSHVLIPSNSTVKTVKSCLQSQHNLSPALISLIVMGELASDMSFRDFHPSNGDVLTILPQKYTEKQLTASICRDNYLTSVFFYAQTEIKDILCKVSMDKTEGFMRGMQVLEADKTFAACGIVTDVVLHVGKIEEFRRTIEDLTRFRLIPASMWEETKDIVEESGVKVQLITAEAVLNLLVHPQATVEALKADLHLQFPLLHAGQPLDSSQTLLEQGVTQGSALLLVPPGSVWVHVDTPAGRRHAVVLQPRDTMLALRKVLDQLMRIHSYRVVFSKRMREERDLVPAATATVGVSVN